MKVERQRIVDGDAKLFEAVGGSMVWRMGTPKKGR